MGDTARSHCQHSPWVFLSCVAWSLTDLILICLLSSSGRFVTLAVIPSAASFLGFLTCLLVCCLQCLYVCECDLPSIWTWESSWESFWTFWFVLPYLGGSHQSVMYWLGSSYPISCTQCCLVVGPNWICCLAINSPVLLGAFLLRIPINQ